MSHGQASKDAHVYRYFRAPSPFLAGESSIASFTDGVDGDDLSFYASQGSTSDGKINFAVDGSIKLILDPTILHLDESTTSAATLWGGGQIRLGKSDARWGMAWFRGFQIADDQVAPTTWNGASVLGFASVGSGSISGAAQTITPPSQVFRLSAASSASALKIAAPPGDYPTILTIIFDDGNVTLTDSGTGGAAETMNLNGGDYTSSADGVVRLLWNNNPASGNKRWLELSRTSP